MKKTGVKVLKNNKWQIEDKLVLKEGKIYVLKDESLSGTVHTGVEVRRMYSEMSRLVERPWLQLMCCAVCLPRGRNFR